MNHIEGLKRMIDRQLEQGKQEEELKRKETASLFAERSRVHLVIKGKVQGVFFRAFIEKTADELKLAGFVRNKEDGTVEVVTEGEKPALEQLITACRKGPRSAGVTDIDVKWEKFKGEFGDFMVKD